MLALPKKGLYAITDCENLATASLIKKTEEILNAGAVLLQYRNKSADQDLKIRQAGMLRQLCNKYQIPFIINDDVELARTIQADGVHLGKDDTSCKKAKIILGPDCIIGASCYNNLERGRIMQDSGASYLAFGAFYPTNTKLNTVTAKPAIISEAKRKLSLPVVAIGGITPENGKILVAAGADFLAVISGIYAAENQAKAVRSYLNLFN